MMQMKRYEGSLKENKTCHQTDNCELPKISTAPGEARTSACLVPPSGGGEGTDYKYGALTDCATGAG